MVNELGEIGSAGAPISSQVPSPAAEVQRRSWREWLGVWAVGAGTLVVAPLFTQLVGDWFSAPRTEISGFVSGGHTGAGGGSAWLDEEGNQVSISYSYLWLLNTGETPVSVTGIDLPARYAMGDARYCADRHGSLQPGQSQLVLLVRGGSDSSGLSDADGPLTAYTPEKLVIELSNERDAAFSLVPSNFEVSEVLDQCGQLEAAPSSGSAG